MNLPSDPVSASAIAMLQQVRAELAIGNDVIPARLFAIEALLTQAIAAGVAPAGIKEAVEKLLPEGRTITIAEPDKCPVVTLQLWQKRAPVVPST